MYKKNFLIISLLFSFVFLIGCQSTHKKACCRLPSISGKAAVKAVNSRGPKGFVIFEKADHGKSHGKSHHGKSHKRGKVRVRAEITNLKPNQKFGFHVHEFGDCSDKALKAGGHLISYHHKSKRSFHKNKKILQHGSPLSPNKHLGDLGNLSSNSKGKASYNEVLNNGHFKSFLGRSVIIHEKEDDLTSQPTGNSGSRIACGVIVASLPEPQKAQQVQKVQKVQKTQK